MLSQETVKSDILLFQFISSLIFYYNRMCKAEERISELEDISWHNNEVNKKPEEELSQTRKIIQELRDTIKRSNIRVMGVPEGTEK